MTFKLSLVSNLCLRKLFNYINIDLPTIKLVLNCLLTKLIKCKSQVCGSQHPNPIDAVLQIICSLQTTKF